MIEEEKNKLKNKSQEPEELNEEADERKNKTLRIIIIISSIVLVVTAITLSIFHFWLGYWLVEIYDETEGRNNEFERICCDMSEGLLNNLPMWLIGRGLASVINDSDAKDFLRRRGHKAIPYVLQMLGDSRTSKRKSAEIFIVKYISGKEEKYQEVINILPEYINSRHKLKRESSLLIIRRLEKKFRKPLLSFIEKRLHDESLRIRGISAYILAEHEIFNEEFIPICRDLLASGSSENNYMTFEIVYFLKERGSPLIPLLVEAAITLEDDYDRDCIALLLANIGPAALPYLIKKLEKCPDSHKPVLLECIEAFKEKGKSALPLVRQMMEHKDPETRINAAKAYIKISDKDYEKAYEILFAVCNGKSPERRALGALWLKNRYYGCTEYPRILNVLGKLLKDKDKFVLVQTIHSIGSYEEKASRFVPLLIQTYKNHNEGDVPYTKSDGTTIDLNIRNRIVLAISFLKNRDPEVYSFLEEIIRKGLVPAEGPGHSFVRENEFNERETYNNAIDALRRIGPRKNNVPILIKLLDDELTSVRIKSLFCLGSLGKDSIAALDKVIALFNSKYNEVQQAALYAAVDIAGNSERVINEIKQAVDKDLVRWRHGYNALAMTFDPGLVEYFRNQKLIGKRRLDYEDESIDIILIVFTVLKQKDAEPLKKMLMEMNIYKKSSKLVVLKAIGKVGTKDDIKFLQGLTSRLWFCDEESEYIINNAIRDIESRVQDVEENKREKMSEERVQQASEDRKGTPRNLIIVLLVMFILGGLTLLVCHIWLGTWLLWIYDDTSSSYSDFDEWCHDVSKSLLKNLPLWLIGRGLAREIDDYEAREFLEEREYDSVPYVLPLLGHEDEAIRKEAITLIYVIIQDNKQYCEKFVKVLPRYMNDKNELVRENALILVTALDKKTVGPLIPLLEKKLFDPSLKIRGIAGCVMARNKLYNKEIMSICKELLQSKDEDLIYWGFALVSELGDRGLPLVPDLLKIAVESKDSSLGLWIIELLPRIGPKTIPYVMEALKTCPDEKKTIMLPYLEAFGKNGKQTLPLLNEMMKHSDEDIRVYAAKAYIKISDKDYDKAYEILFKMCRDTNALTRASAAGSLHIKKYGNQDNPKIIIALIDLLNDQDVDVIHSAVNSLKSYKSKAKSAAPLLAQVYKRLSERKDKDVVSTLGTERSILETIALSETESPEVYAFLEDLVRKGITPATPKEQSDVKVKSRRSRRRRQYNRSAVSNQAFQTLYSLGFRKESVPLLILLLDDVSSPVRRKVLRGLRLLGEDGDPALEKVLSLVLSKDYGIRIESVYTAAEIAEDTQKVIEEIRELIAKKKIPVDTGYAALTGTFEPGLVEYFKEMKEKDKKNPRYDRGMMDSCIEILEAVKAKDSARLKALIGKRPWNDIMIQVIIKALGKTGTSSDIEYLKKMKKQYRDYKEYMIYAINNAIKGIEKRYPEEKVEKEQVGR